MRVAFCTTCKGRLAHIQETLPANIASNTEAVHILLDYNSRDGLADWVRADMRAHLDSGRLVYYRFTEPVPFQMARAKNIAHRCGLLEGADLLVNVDADNHCGEGFDHYVQAQLSDRQGFLWSRMIQEGDGRLPRGISGRIAVTAEQFRLSGGYDERFETWSPDDKDFCSRLGGLGFDPREVDQKYLKAIQHNDKLRFREYEHAAASPVGEDFERLTNGARVVNDGCGGCAVLYRNFCPDPVILDSMPARVWGVGMHKTGTTSLAKALTRLGYRCAHWSDAHWAKRVYHDMIHAGRSVDLERQMAATDLPLTLLWRQLDKAYPGSKFVLTTRPEDDWLRSVEAHFSPTNPFFSAWDTDPFSHKLHTLLYGRRKFDREVMLATYRRHVTQVREAFRDRPGDLLEFEIGAAGWHELCGFLRSPLPGRPFPRENQMRRE